MKSGLSSVVLLFFLLFAAMGVAAPQNFIIILTDDQGYEDLGCFGSPTIKTPNIDRLAAEGMRMTSFYVASSVCSPSRAALMTGRMPKRVGVPGVLFPRSTTGLPPSEITIAEMLKTKGYKTAVIGKWHLGHQKKYMPMNQGFDSFFGIPYSNDMSISKEFDIAPDVKLNDGYTLEMMEQDRRRYLSEYKKLRNKVPLLRGNTIIEYPVDQRTLTRRYTEEAVKFIRANRKNPFFLYVAHTMPHRPLSIENAFAGRSKGGLYGDTIEQIDWSVGEIVKTLKANGLDKKTLILYCSDNGHSGQGGSSGPLRGKKFMTFEGGQRVVSIIWAPGAVQAGIVCDEMVSTLDIFPTIAHYVGVELPKDRTYDGYNMADLLEGKTAKSPRNVFYFYTANSETIDGIRMGDWKYLIHGERPGGGRKNKKGQSRSKRPAGPMLFNLKDDIGESNNLINKYPEKAAELIRKMKAFDATVKQP